MVEFNQVVTIDGKKYDFKGNVDFSNLSIKKIEDNVPDPEPEPNPDPTKPDQGVIKPGGWGADLVNKSAWKVVNMKNPPNEFKVVDAAGKNVATNFKTKEVAENFIAYFQNHPFPPEDVTPPTPDPEPPVPEPPTPNGGDVTEDGVILPGGLKYTGKSSTKYNNNDRDDGKRMDFKDLKGWSNNTAVYGYFAFPNGKAPDDEVSGKWSVESHSGENEVQCLDIGVGIKDGSARWRFENPHPTYTGNLGKEIVKGKPLDKTFVGYLFVRRDLPDGTSVNLQVYQDQGNSEGAKPANQWVKIADWIDKKYNIRKYPVGPLITIRVDGSNVVSDMKIKFVRAIELSA